MAGEDKDRIEERQAPYVISPDLLDAFEEAQAEAAGKAAAQNREAGAARLPVIIELSLTYPAGRPAALDVVHASVLQLKAQVNAVGVCPKHTSRHHVIADLTLPEVRELVALHGDIADPRRAIYKVWPDREIRPLLDRSVRAIKADACLRSFGSDGDGILWGVIDSGVDGTHPHFRHYRNLDWEQEGGDDDSPLGLRHRDFTSEGDPLRDDYGHGTHVAGIIAGATPPAPDGTAAGAERIDVSKVVKRRDDENRVRGLVQRMTHQIQGVAPRCRLLSLKVMDADGKGRESLILAALDYVSRVNDDGRWQRIHGVNLSLGYTFNAEWFAAGHSPICVAVNRLVRMGVVVVAAAGNDGSAIIETELGGRKRIGLDQSIADPGNAEGAITVGSTHPEQPHTYGISYFSSRGPTADGRPKPDLVAPGERILSCASPASLQRMALDDAPLQAALGQAAQGQVFYREETGTSMAAPHVSGAVAAFLSVRPEFKGQPERIKEILMASATDLRRKADFQGAGLLDLLRAIQSV